MTYFIKYEVNMTRPINVVLLCLVFASIVCCFSIVVCTASNVQAQTSSNNIGESLKNHYVASRPIPVTPLGDPINDPKPNI